MKKRANLELKFIVSLIFAVIVSIFAIQNAGSIEVRFFFANFRISQAVVILGSTIIGAIIVLLLGLVKHIKHNKIIRQMSKELEALTLENETLKIKLEDLSGGQTQEEKIYQFEETLEETLADVQQGEENVDKDLGF